jgi:hypothetical protein
MFKYIILLTALFLIYSCSMPNIDNNWYDLDKLPLSLENTTDPIKIFNWTVNNVVYKEYANGFVPAQKTLNRGTGNCANIALLTLALNYSIRQSKGDLILCEQKNLTTGITGLHYTSRIDSVILEPGIIQIYKVIRWEEIPAYIYINQGE